MPNRVKRRQRPVQPPVTHDPQVYRDTEDALREVLQEAMAEGAVDTSDWAMGTGTGDAPFVGSPPGWGSYRPVGPGSDLAQMMRRLETIAPGIRESLSGDVSLGPNKRFIERALEGWGGPEWIGTGLNALPAVASPLGMATVGEDEQVWLSPQQKSFAWLSTHRRRHDMVRDEDLFSMLTHELIHTARDPKDAFDQLPSEIGEALARMLYEGSSAPSKLGTVDDPEMKPKTLEGLDTRLGEKPWYNRRRP